MKEQAKQGKKRRSDSKRKVRQIEHDKRASIALEALFNFMVDDTIRIDDKELERDILDAMDFIKQLTTYEEAAEKKLKEKMINEKQKAKGMSRTEREQSFAKGYKQDVIDGLNNIMQKMPIRVGVDFVPYSIIGKTTSGFDLFRENISDQVYKDVEKDVLRLRKRPGLSGLKLIPLPESERLLEDIGDKQIRHFLTIGIFDYLQTLINGEKPRLKLCKECGYWFIAERSTKIVCGERCKSRYWNRRNRKKCVEKSLKWREK